MGFSTCTEDIGVFDLNNCGTPTPGAGGIELLIFGKPNIEDDYALISAPTVLAQWQAAYLAGDVVIMQVVGEKAKAEPTTQITSSKNIDKPVSYRQVVSFMEKNTASSVSNHEFYNKLIRNAGGHFFSYVDSDDQFYGWAENPSFDATLVHEQTKDGIKMWQGQTAWTRTVAEGVELVPVAWVNLEIA